MLDARKLLIVFLMTFINTKLALNPLLATIKNLFERHFSEP